MSLKSKAGNFPRIAYVGAEALTISHGTGQMFSRHFSNYPKTQILDIHSRPSSDGYLFKRLAVLEHDLRSADWKSPLLQSMNARLKGNISNTNTSLIYQNHVFDPLQVNWNDLGGPPDLIYSTCYSARDFAFLHHVYRYLPKKVPIVQHFLDLDLSSYENMVALYYELLPAIAEVWALNESIRDLVSRFSFYNPKIVLALQQNLPKQYKKKHINVGRNFLPVIIGNIWSGGAYNTLRDLWMTTQLSIETLPSISWAGHKRRFSELARFNIFPKNESESIIRDVGYLTDSKLRRFLSAADVAIVPFSGATIDKEDYIKYSLPSRIGEYCANGLPIVLISRQDTEPWNLVQKYELGIAIDPADRKISIRKLKHFLLDREWRAECGRKSRDFAARELNLNVYQKELYPKLFELSQHKIHKKFLESRFSLSEIETDSKLKIRGNGFMRKSKSEKK